MPNVLTTDTEALAIIGEAVRKSGLSVVTFTGYLLEDILAAQRTDFSRLLGVTDILIDGPFNQDLIEFSRPWVGSSNQRYHFMTDRYGHLAEGITDIPNRFEIRIGPDGNIIAGGLAPTQLSKGMFKDIAALFG